MPSVATLSRVKAKTDARHLMRYLRSKAGVSVADLAKAEGISVKTINDSIRQMEAYESRNSEGQLQLAVRDLMISIVPQAKETMTGLLQATTILEVKNQKTGQMEPKAVEDKITRLEAMKVFNGMVAATQPKVPQIQQNITQTNQTAVLSSAETTEERMRRLKAAAAAHNLLPPVVTGVPELIDKGFDPDDDEDDDDE